MISPFSVKICGLTSAECVERVVAAGADAIGLNFVAQSPRFLELANRSEVVDAIPASVTSIGVFVNESLAAIEQIKASFRLGFIQLHGDDPPEMLKDLPAGTVIRAIRCGNTGFSPVSEFLAVCERIDAMPAAILVDAFSNTAYGGTGRVVDWAALSGWRERVPSGMPLILAGGLKPENVAEAIQIVRPTGVDTASGVEAESLRKDARLVADFVSAARNALDSIRDGE